VLAIARELFYWNGIRATGVDRIASDAEVAPTTLYRLFASKDDLVAAYIEREALNYRAWFDGVVEAAESDPRSQILAVFDALGEEVQPDRCRGCPFLMTLAELPDSDHPAHRHAVELKSWVRARLGELAGRLGETATVGDADALADQLSLVMDGVYGSVQALGAAGPARRARALVEELLAPRTGA
jgi:AcrR family transcriptional regulator